MGQVQVLLAKGLIGKPKRFLRLPCHSKHSRLKPEFSFSIDLLQVTDPIPPLQPITAVGSMVFGEIRLIIGTWNQVPLGTFCRRLDPFAQSGLSK